MKSKLTENQVLEIRKKLELRELTGVIARQYGVGRATIKSIELRRTWTHI